MLVANLETKNVNTELETKVGDQMEDSVLEKTSIVENHRKLHDHRKETIKKTINNVKANGNHIVPRTLKPRRQKLGNPGARQDDDIWRHQEQDTRH